MATEKQLFKLPDEEMQKKFIVLEEVIRKTIFDGKIQMWYLAGLFRTEDQYDYNLIMRRAFTEISKYIESLDDYDLAVSYNEIMKRYVRIREVMENGVWPIRMGETGYIPYAHVEYVKDIKITTEILDSIAESFEYCVKNPRRE
jgi:hypothetical protein